MLVAGLLGPALALGQDGTQVMPGPNGQTEVRVGDGRCVVLFDRQGQRVREASACSRRDVRRAEAADARWREQVRRPWPETAPQTVVRADGSGSVVIDRQCRVEYDRTGRRVDAVNGCSRAQIEQSDRLMADARDARRLDRPTGGVSGRGAGDERPGHGQGDVRFADNGDGSVRFSNGCTVWYRPDGARWRGSRECNRAQELRADELMQTFRQLRENAKQTGVGGS